MKFKLQCYLNHYRRKLIHFLLSDSLVIEKRETANSCTYELIDMKKRIPFGRYKVVESENVVFSGQSDSSVTSFVISKL